MNEKYINLSREERVSLCVNKVNQVLQEFGCTVLPQVVSKDLNYGEETNTQVRETARDTVSKD